MGILGRLGIEVAEYSRIRQPSGEQAINIRTAFGQCYQPVAEGAASLLKLRAGEEPCVALDGLVQSSPPLRIVQGDAALSIWREHLESRR